MTLVEYADPYTGKQVKEGKSKAPLRAASESVAVGKPWSYALRGQCILPARPVVMIIKMDLGMDSPHLISTR